MRLALPFLLLFPLAAAAQPGAGRRGPPPSAYTACAGQAEGAACSFQTPGGPRPGQCFDLDGRMACVPADAPRPPRRAEAPGSAAAALPPLSQEAIESASAFRGAVAAAAAVQPVRPLAEAVPAAPVDASANRATPAAPSPAPGFPYGAALGALACGIGLLALWRSSTGPAPTASVDAPPKAAPRGTLMQPPMEDPPPAPPKAKVTPAAARGPKGGVLVGGHYELGRELGAGGMGVVYEAVDLTLDRRVALKKMRPEIGMSASGRQRFLDEAKTVAKLQHRNIVTIHGIVEEDKDLYLVFEYVEGRTLDALLAERQRLTNAEALSVLGGVAAAVDYAHEHRVIHRDLKPANIMIGADGEAKVMDFGIAHQAKLTISQMTIAEAYGTLAYMPPEQELGQAVRESDVYAFAALTYESLTGVLPFPGPNFHLQKSAMSFTRPSGHFPPLTPKLDPVFERAFQVEPKKRQPTTGEFVRHLQTAFAVSGA